MPCIRILDFDDPALCQNAFINSNFDAFAKESGNFRFKLTQIGMERLWMSRYRLSLTQVNVFNIKPERTVIAFLTDPRWGVRYSGMKILPGDIIINRTGEVHQQTERGLDGGTMSLPVNDLNSAIEAIVDSDFMQRVANPVIRPSPALMSRLLGLHKAVGKLVHENPGILEVPEVCRALEEQLTHLMIRCLAEGASVTITTGHRRRDAILPKFEEYLAAHPNQPIYLTEICAGIGVSERTLRTACEEHIGMGPIRYLALRRMHFVRRALLGADASKTNVTRIATGYGFWELGRFSVAYRELFGESPVHTLRRPQERPKIYGDRPSLLPADIVAGLPN